MIIVASTLLLGALTTSESKGKFPTEAFGNKGLPQMLRHRPWYSGKREKLSLHNEVRKFYQKYYQMIVQFNLENEKRKTELLVLVVNTLLGASYSRIDICQQFSGGKW